MATPTKIWDYSNNFIHAFGYTYNDPSIGPITVTADGIIKSSGTFGLTLYYGGVTPTNYALTNNGIIGSAAAGEAGILVDANAAPTSLTKVTNGATGDIFGDSGILLFGNTNIANAGAITGSTYGIFNHWTGSGATTITNTGTITGGSDSLIFAGGLGTHTIKNSGTLNGGVYSLGQSVELFTNSGVVNGNIDLGGGNNVLTNSGLINGDLLFGSGNDKFIDSGSVSAGHGIQMGAGDDQFIGGKASEIVYDEAGNDKYSLGDGFDVFVAVNLGSGSGFIDTVDGGTNSGVNPTANSANKGDTYDAGDAINALVINLDTVSHIEPAIGGGLIYAAAQATGTDVGTDNIKNFESAIGGDGSDIIFGNALANFINGNAGHDVLHGYAGNDYIAGGTGSDYLFGDKGADTLVGGVGDHTADYFFYGALTDSTVALSGRDTIFLFEDGFDKIVLQGIPGHNSGAFLGVDALFAPVLGQLEVRAITTTAGWTLQVDANGDGKVDMAIDVSDSGHLISWAPDNFIF